jgi:hypothetical protein
MPKTTPRTGRQRVKAKIADIASSSYNFVYQERMRFERGIIGELIPCFHPINFVLIVRVRYCIALIYHISVKR